MRDSNWRRSAHLRLKNCYARHFYGAAFVAVVLVGLLAIFSPPYIPSPYTLAVAEPFKLDPPPEYEVPPAPAAIPTPQMPIDIDPFDGSGPEDPLPLQLNNPMVPVTAAISREPSQAPMAFEEPPSVVRSVLPEYPEIARAAHAEGNVAIGVSIDTNGRVVAAWVHASDTIEALEIAALEAARQFLFTPCLQSDVAVPCQVVLRFAFVLDGGR